jgi:hypothetical protein
MKLNDTELLTTAALIRSLLRLELLDEHDRQEALSAVVDTLELRREEIDRSQQDRGGYRDAARIVRHIATDLDPWLVRAAREVSSEEALRRLIEREAVSREARRAILRAVQVFASHGTLEPSEELFVGWLAMVWGE